MSQITIMRIQEAGTESSALKADLEALEDRIRERAFAIFQQRDSGESGPLDHWLEAERDLRVKLESNLVENDSEFQLSLAVAGLDAEDLNLSALPGALVVRTASQATGSNGFGEKTLFSRFELPAGINVDQVTATLDNGVLRITAPKALAGQRATGKKTVGSEKAAAAKAAAA